MAYDATVRGNWGCAPENYPPALQLVLDEIGHALGLRHSNRHFDLTS